MRDLRADDAIGDDGRRDVPDMPPFACLTCTIRQSLDRRGGSIGGEHSVLITRSSSAVRRFGSSAGGSLAVLAAMNVRRVP
jgi:hypothetical protein